MKQIWLITQREFLVEARKKSFLLLTFAMPFIMVGIMALVVVINLANSEDNTIAVVDESGLFTDAFPDTGQDHYIPFPASDFQMLKDSLEKGEFLQGILYIPKTDSSFQSLKSGIEFISNKNIGVSLIPQLERSIENKLEQLNLQKKGISWSEIEQAKFPVDIQASQEIKGTVTQTNQMTETIKSVVSGGLMYATFMFIMIYGVRVMRSVIEEKNNRVVEIIISSVKPFHLMMGKILGTTLVALTQFSIWIITIVLLLLLFPALIGQFAEAESPMQQAAIQPDLQQNVQDIVTILFNLNVPLIVGVFFIYFFFGYLFYSSLFAAIGSSVENDSETQQFMWLGIAPLMLGLYGSFSIFQNPDGPVGFWFSMIPFTSPVTMMARITYGVPVWELLLSIGLLIGSMILMVLFAAKIYRVGILMYGKKATLKEWLKWLRY